MNEAKGSDSFDTYSEMILELYRKIFYCIEKNKDDNAINDEELESKKQQLEEEHKRLQEMKRNLIENKNKKETELKKL